MIEAVNSAIASAGLLRGTAEQVSQARPVSASSPADAEKRVEPPQAPYISPYIEVDTRYNKAVLQIRDSDTGDVLRQFPSENDLQNRQLNSAPEAPAIQERSEGGVGAVLGGLQKITVSTAAPSSPGLAQAHAVSAAFTAGAQTAQTQTISVNVTA